MDFLDCQYELNNVRVSLRSNPISSTLYVEELPDYENLSHNLRILTVYFYFRGNTGFDVLGLFESIRKMSDSEFDVIEKHILETCAEHSKGEDDIYSHSLKDVNIFSVKPRKGYKVFVSGKDFVGYSLWGSFFFLSKDRKFCVCKDKESANKLFITIHNRNECLNNKTYLFLIKLLNCGDIHFAGDL